MKSKLLLGVILCLVFNSCIKEFYGHPDDKEGILTENNFVYTDDLKRAYLEKVEVEINEELEQLNPIKEKDRYVLLTNQLQETQSKLEDIADFRESVFKRRPPLPPCPKPQSCQDWLKVQYLTQRPGLDKLQMKIYDKNQNIVAQTQGELQELSGLEVPLDYIVLLFENPEYHGDIQIEIIETIDDNDVAFVVDSQIP